MNLFATGTHTHCYQSQTKFTIGKSYYQEENNCNIQKNTIYFLSLNKKRKCVKTVLQRFNYEKKDMSLVLQPPEDLLPKPIKITSSIMKMKGKRGLESRGGVAFNLKVYPLGPTVRQLNQKTTSQLKSSYIYVFVCVHSIAWNDTWHHESRIIFVITLITNL